MRAQEDRFAGDVSYVPPGEAAGSLLVFGELVTRKVPGSRTGGAYSLFEVTTPPRGGPPPHVQHREDEAFYVLEGEYEFTIEGRAIMAGVGALLYVPRGDMHSHKNVAEKPGRMLVSQTPGGLHERFFEEIGEPVVAGSLPPRSEGPVRTEKLAAIAAEYGIEIPPIPDR